MLEDIEICKNKQKMQNWPKIVKMTKFEYFSKNSKNVKKWPKSDFFQKVDPFGQAQKYWPHNSISVIRHAYESL